MKKQVFIKTYTASGTFKGVFYDFIFSQFQSGLNGGLGDLQVTIPRKFDEYNSDGAIDLGYELKIYIADSEAPSGIQIYSGMIDDIQVAASDSEKVSINCSGYVHQLALDLFELPGRIIYKKYTSTELSAIIKDILDQYKARRSDDKITYDSGSTTIDTVGRSATVEIYNNSPLEAINHVIDECPENWFWRVGVDNNFYLNAFPTSPTHYFIMGKDIIELSIDRNLRDVRTGILVTNGLPSSDSDSILTLYTDASATGSYGRRIERKNDGRYKATAGTANNFGNRYKNLYKDPLNVVNLRIIDSNLADGYNIESIKPGDTCKVLNITDNDALSDNMLITTVSYNIDYVDLTVTDVYNYTGRMFFEQKQQQNLVAFTDDQKQTYTKY